jgi:preprotein translocase subunit SecG
MQGLIFWIHIGLAFSIIGLVLLQHGKGAEANTFTAGNSQSLFGAEGANSFLSKLTGYLAVAFVCTSLGINYMNSRANRSILEQVEKLEVVEKQSAALPDLPLITTSKVNEAKNSK